MYYTGILAKSELLFIFTMGVQRGRLVAPLFPHFTCQNVIKANYITCVIM